MKFECPECGNGIETSDETAAKVRCASCSALVTSPSSTAVTETPRARPRYAAEDEPPRRDQQPSSRGSRIGLIIGILIVLGGPLLLVLGCAGVSVLATLATHDQRQMVAAQRPAVQVQANEAVAEEAQPIDMQPPKLGAAGQPPPVLLDMDRLNEFIEQNLAVNPQNGALAPNAPIWKKLAAADQKKLVASPINQGNGGVFGFRETAPDGGLLVGFFASAPDELFVHYLQPIYLTAKGEKVGKARGVPQRRVACIKARDGYAVGAIDIRSGDQIFDSFAVRFMRVRDDSLDVRDWYSSQRIGGLGGAAWLVGGDGALIVGVHGRALNQANLAPAGSVTTLGVLSLR